MVAARTACTLCGQPVLKAVSGADGGLYCCHACKEVAILIQEPAPEMKPDLPPVGETEQVTLHISGLWCTSCAWLVEERLNRLPGIAGARVSYLERKARVTFDGGRIQTKAIRRKIKGYGYRASLNEDLDEEERFFTRMLVGGLLAMHIMVTSLIIYARDWMGLSTPEAAWLENFFYLMQMVVSLPLSVVLGLPILRAGINSLLRGLPNVQALVTIGALGALSISVRNLISGSGHVYFDTAAMLLFLVTIGRWLEMKAQRSGRTAFQALEAALPESARLVTPGGEAEISLSEIRPGQRIRALPGDRIPADGLIAAGRGEIDESPLTGEPLPVLRQAGDPVFAGTINVDGAIELIVSHTGAGTRAGQIRTLLEKLVWQRSPVEKLADRMAAWMVYVAIGIGAATFAGYLLTAGLETALLNSLSVLLIACPCALGIATPLTLRQAFSRAAENGILLRRAGLLEKLVAVRRIYFDKTGTLTQLPHQVLKTIPADGGEFIERAAALEALSRHPFAQAIASFADLQPVKDAQDFSTIPGAGVKGVVEGEPVWVGNRRLMQANDLPCSEGWERAAGEAEEAGGVVIYTGWAGRVRGAFVIGETPRADAKTALEELQSLGLAPSVLTGDTPVSGRRWAKRLGIPVRAGLGPEDKLAIIRAASEQAGRHAAMVGDGINDGPALAAAAIGIAMRSGADMAQSAAEITLVGDDLAAIPWLYRLALETRRILRQNLVWAAAYNIIGIGLAIAGLLQPVLAALAMVVSSAIVTRNALQLRHFPSWKKAKEEDSNGSGALAPIHTTAQDTI